MNKMTEETEHFMERLHITFDEVDEQDILVKEHDYILNYPGLPVEEFFLTSGYLVLATGRIRNYKVARLNSAPENLTGIQKLYAQALLERQREGEASRERTQ
jgi:hypothetical protein